MTIHQVAFDRSAIADVDLLSGTDPAQSAFSKDRLINEMTEDGEESTKLTHPPTT